MATIDPRYPVSIESGGQLQKDRKLFKFGRYAQVVLTNGTGSARTFEIAPQDFYVVFPDKDHRVSQRTTFEKDHYFYASVPAGETWTSSPMSFPRGLMVRSQNSSKCYAQALIFDVPEGETRHKGEES